MTNERGLLRSDWSYWRIKRRQAVMPSRIMHGLVDGLFIFLLIAIILPDTFILGFVPPSTSSAQRSSVKVIASGDVDCPGSSTNVDHTEEELLCSGVSVLYESDRVLATDKPTGIPHHNGENESGILSMLRKIQASGGLQYQGRLYGVHRLDRVTSGILLLAKDAEMASKLTRAFRDGRVTKYYVGVSSRARSRKKQGWVKGNMVRGRRKSWYLARKGDDSSCMAVTRFFSASLSSLRECAVDSSAPPMTCLLFRPYTGRTHQLRVAAKSVGLPLDGDPIYRDGSNLANKVRTCLHASAIHIYLDEGPISIYSPSPFEHLWTKGTKGKEEFDATVIRLLQKHCDCDPILARLNEYNNGSRE